MCYNFSVAFPGLSMAHITQDGIDMSSIYTLTDKSKLSEFALNPRNIRTLDSIKIQSITRTENGVALTEFDPDGNRLGFQLGEFQCTAQYRKQFNDYLSGLITIEGRKVKFATLPNCPVVTTWKQPLEIDEPVVSIGPGAQGTSYYWIVDGNTRMYIVKQLLDLLGDDLDVFIHYTHYKGKLEGEALLFAAPTLGFNSSVPVLEPDTVQAEKFFRRLTAGGTGVDALAKIKDTFLKSSTNPTGWSVAKMSYVLTSLALGQQTGLLTKAAHGVLNTEFQSVYLRHWYTQVTCEKYRVGAEISAEVVERIKEAMGAHSIEKYVEETLRLPDFRITSNTSWEGYLTWVSNRIAPATEPSGEVQKEVTVKEVTQQTEVEEEPITEDELRHFGENLLMLSGVFNELGEQEAKAAADKLTSPLVTAVMLLAESDPLLLEPVLLAIAESLDTLKMDKIGAESAKSIRTALKNALKLNKAFSR